MVDAPRQEILDAVRAEIDAGRLEHDTPVLHVARSFQQWVATPLGVFDGVDETFVSLDPEVSHQTVGGRLYGLDVLPEVSRPGTYAYVVLEPDGLAPDGRRGASSPPDMRSIFANDQGRCPARALTPNGRQLRGGTEGGWWLRCTATGACRPRDTSRRRRNPELTM